MSPRRVVLSAVALTLLAASGALAAPRAGAARRCPLTDPAGDTAVHGVPVRSGAADVICADLVPGRRELVAVLRVQDLADRVPAAGYAWRLTARFGGVEVDFTHAQGAPGSAPTGAVRAGGTEVPFVFQVAGNALLWRVDRDHLKQLRKPDGRCRALAATTTIGAVTADEAGAAAAGKGCATAS